MPTYLDISTHEVRPHSINMFAYRFDILPILREATILITANSHSRTRTTDSGTVYGRTEVICRKLQVSGLLESACSHFRHIHKWQACILRNLPLV